MPSSLGIYIDSSMIKYARLTKEKDSIKVDGFNVLFYDNLSKALEQVVEEADAFKLPICTNIDNEIYGYAEVFAELSKKDIKSSVEIEFEMDCSDKNYNKDTLEMRYLIMGDGDNKEKYKALYIATDKAEISKRAQILGQYKLSWMTPISNDIVNLVELNPRDDVAIINIEDETKITTLVKGAVNRIDAVNIGMKDILGEINKTENSLSKSYDICKNITIYTKDMQSDATGENEHLESIMPILYKLVNECKSILEDSFGNISKVLITGSAAVISNLDLYFQEYLPQMKCEILRPYFLEGGNVKTNIKDYIEVNSAMALAMNALGDGMKDINYATSAASAGGDVKVLAKKYGNMIKGQLGLGHKKQKSEEKENKFDIKKQLSGPFDPIDKVLVRASIAGFAAVIGLLIFSLVLGNGIKAKSEEIAESAKATDTELSKISSEISKITEQTTKYETLISVIEEYSNPQSDNKVTQITRDRIISKNSIPNLLTGLMTKIPQKVKLTSIENTEDTHIVIEAQSAQYEQLGYFKGLITTNNILTNVKSTSGEKDGSIVKIKIEGDLP